MTSARAHHRPRRGTLHVSGPPMAALVVSSPAIVAGFSGQIATMTVLSVLAMSFAGAWMLSAVALHLGGAAARPSAPEPVRHLDRDLDASLDQFTPPNSESEGSLP